MADVHQGTCFCGIVAIEVTGTPLEMGYCHCNSCRSYSGAPVSAFILWEQEHVRVTKGAEFIGGFQKTEMSDRRFCTKCGGHLLVNHPSLGLAHVHAAIVPTVTFKPTVHLHYAASVLPIKDGLPKLKDFPVEVGGSGETMPE
jgi:hypothetical protein